jgi:hypothetical protein
MIAPAQPRVSRRGTMEAGLSPTGSMKLRRTRAAEQQRPRPRQPCPEAQQQPHQPRRQRRRCVCLPGNYGPAQFPAVWSELRFDSCLYYRPRAAHADRTFQGPKSGPRQSGDNDGDGWTLPIMRIFRARVQPFRVA